MLIYWNVVYSLKHAVHVHSGPGWLMDPKGTLSSPYPPCHVVMPNFSQHKRDNDRWFSQPFYSGPGGYKLCLRIAANGVLHFTGSYVTVLLNLMKGENDHLLQWPFEHAVTYGILNWKKDESHVIHTIDFKFYPKERVTSTEIAPTGCGIWNTLSHSTLYGSKDEHIEYLREDCLCLQVLKVEPPQ